MWITGTFFAEKKDQRTCEGSWIQSHVQGSFRHMHGSVSSKVGVLVSSVQWTSKKAIEGWGHWPRCSLEETQHPDSDWLSLRPVTPGKDSHPGSVRQVTLFVPQLYPTLCNLMDCIPPGSSPWDSPGKNTGVGGHSLLQGIFPTQGSNLDLLHCSQIPYHLARRKAQLHKQGCIRMEERHPTCSLGSPHLEAGNTN